MKQAQKDKFIRLYKAQHENDSWERVEKAAKHFLCAVSFRISSLSAFSSTGSVLLPPIGQYYSLFHLSVCLCWLNPEIEKEKLYKLKHSTLKGLIQTHFIGPTSLNKSFIDLIEELQEEREWLNYTFGEFGYDFKEKISENEAELNSEFEAAVALIFEINDAVVKSFNLCERIRTYIADSKGDDFMDTYLSATEYEAVVNLLLEYKLTN